MNPCLNSRLWGIFAEGSIWSELNCPDRVLAGVEMRCNVSHVLGEPGEKDWGVVDSRYYGQFLGPLPCIKTNLFGPVDRMFVVQDIENRTYWRRKIINASGPFRVQRTPEQDRKDR